MAKTQPLPSLLLPVLGRLAAIRPTPRALAVLALVGANAIWGGSAVATEAAFVHVPPLTLACLRCAAAGRRAAAPRRCLG